MKIKNKSTYKVRSVKKHRKSKKSRKSRKMRGGIGVVFQQEFKLSGLREVVKDYKGGVTMLLNKLEAAKKLEDEYNVRQNCEFLGFVIADIKNEYRDPEIKYVFFMEGNKPIGFIQYIINSEDNTIEIKYLCCWYRLISSKPIYHGRSPGQLMMAMFNMYLQILEFSNYLICLQSTPDAIDYYKSCGFESYGENERAGKDIDILQKIKTMGSETLDLRYESYATLYRYVSTERSIEGILDTYVERGKVHDMD